MLIIIVIMDHLIKKLSKFKKPLAQKLVFILLRLALINIWFETEITYFLRK